MITFRGWCRVHTATGRDTPYSIPVSTALAISLGVSVNSIPESHCIKDRLPAVETRFYMLRP